MVEYDRSQEREYTSPPPLKICVIGVGGAGSNVLDRITLDRIVDASLVTMHTDVRVLSHAMTPQKIQLGPDVIRGIGSGGDPDLGREAALQSREKIQAAVQGHDMVFICAGLGGGTASGAAPVIAEIAKQGGALVFAFATTPFSFEGRRRIIQAEVALEELQRHSDAVILFDNNRMGELTLPREGIQKAFSQADQLIGHSVRAIASMVTQPGIIRLGLSDLMSALRTPNGRCLFGFGEARGQNRVAEALKRALKSPLINQGQLLQQARNLMVHVSGGETLTLVEVESLMKQLGKHVPEQTQILFGVSVDQRLGDSIAITLVSSLSAQAMAGEMKPAVVIPAEPVIVTQAVAPAPVEAPVARAKIHLTQAVTPIANEFELPLLETKKEEARRPAEPVVEAKMPAPVAAVPPPPPPPPVEDEILPPVEVPKPAPVKAVPKAPAPVAVQPEPAAPVQDAAPLVKTSIFSVIADESDEDEEPAAIEPAIRPAPSPRQQTRFTEDDSDNSNQRSTSSVATAPEPEHALVGAGSPSPNSLLQSTLNLHQEEVARFKGTDKTIVEGEDLDVPTWMRMRQKVRR